MRLAAAFLTVVPVAWLQPSTSGRIEDDDGMTAAEPGALARASGMFPVVGMCVGAAAALALLFTDRLGLHPLACALAGLAAAAALTGGLHEDGLADFADGIGGGTTPAERLDIMRDSRIGTFGTLALVFSVGMRATLLSQLTSIETVIAALIAAQTLSRAVLPAVMCWLPPARSRGLAVQAGRPETTQVAAAAIIAGIVSVIALDFDTAIAAVVASAIGAGMVALRAQQTLGGQTGDVLGATQQVAELFVLTAIAAME
jgi:adenosylcobinamide-GDP ribazoletransferase